MEGTNGEVLKRIMALLFALADLADRASLTPRPVCALVLAILRPAEAVAQAFVFGTARDLGIKIPPQASPGGGDVDDATHLAFRLRLLALTLANLLAQGERFARHGSVGIATAIHALRKSRQLARCQGAPTPPDTS